MIRIGNFEQQYGNMLTMRFFPMRLNGNPLGRFLMRHVILRHLRSIPGLTVSQAFKRHVEMGIVGMVTGLPNIRTPGDIPYEEWDSWHTLVLNDELSRIVRSPV